MKQLKFHKSPRRRAQSGMSLVEVTLASAMFAGIGMVLTLSMQASQGSHTTVMSTVDANVALRATTTQLRDELRSAQATSIEVATAGDRSTLTFQTAIRGAGGSAAWGAFDRRLDVNEDACHHSGWRIRYEVVNNFQGVATLVRRVINDAGESQCEDTLADDVTEFTVQQSGDIWLVKLTTEGAEGRRDDEFDVRTRNQ